MTGTYMLGVVEGLIRIAIFLIYISYFQNERHPEGVPVPRGGA